MPSPGEFFHSFPETPPMACGHDCGRDVRAPRVVPSACFEGVATDVAGRTVVLPYSVESTEFRTNLGINNLGTATANVTVRLLDKNGLSLGSLAATVRRRVSPRRGPI